MSIRFLRLSISALAIAMACGLLAGCGGSGSSGEEVIPPLLNENPGINDLNLVVAFGDSITKGSQCSCVPYPDRVAGLIGKVVHNSGSGGARAMLRVEKTQTLIDKYHPAYLFILFGVNDVIHGDSPGEIVAALSQMVAICKLNNVLPVLATYPQLIDSHEIFAYNALVLNQGIRALAETEGLRCVDLEKEFTLAPDPATPDVVVPDPALYESDGLHPNDVGTQVMALAFADLF